MTASEMRPEDAREAARKLVTTLSVLADADWTRRAGALEWDCRSTLEHVTHAIDRYCLYLAGPHSERLPFDMPRHPECSIPELLRTLELRAAALCQIATATSPATRGYHMWGSPDASGYVAMGCIEMLVHTDDIAQGLEAEYSPPQELTARVLARLFPWAPADVDPWLALQWATGRLELPEHGRVGPDWAWHASPTSEWDGTVKTVSSYQPRQRHSP